MSEVVEFLNNQINLKDQCIVVACSGGPDSMALLDILVNIGKEKNTKIVCAHVNHKLRIESEMEKEGVKKYCEIHNVIFEYFEIKNYNKENFHNQARNIRYNFFDEIVNKYKAKYLFTAHHGDDLIETILMRITRGSTLNGYSGFHKITPKDNYYIVKPLIFVTKQQLLEYVENNNIKYALDYSNDKDVYTRNRYRKYILPFLKNENKNIHKKYLAFSEKLQKYENFTIKYLDKIYDKIVQDKTLNIKLFKVEDILIQEKLLMRFIYNEYNNKINLINKKHLKEINNIIFSNKANAKIDLPNGLKAIKAYNCLTIVKTNEKINENFNFLFKTKLSLNNKKIVKVKNSDDTTNFTIRLNSKEIKLPLHIRNINVGDKIEIKGLNGTKKVKDIYIDNKIPIDERKNIPLLVDDNNTILWILGIKKSKYDKSKKEFCDIIIRYI